MGAAYRTSFEHKFIGGENYYTKNNQHPLETFVKKHPLETINLITGATWPHNTYTFTYIAISMFCIDWGNDV